ncbi:MAG: DUF4348 domain-containing protein [Bacteroidales bacterium]|nr:DUF4348 domain-containing protein [Candidatus Physcousia equi]
MKTTQHRNNRFAQPAKWMAKTAVVFMMASCNGRQQSDQEWVDSVLATLDAIPDDTTLVMMQEEDIRIDALDANFEDFLFNFLRHPSLREERCRFPMALVDYSGNTLKWLNNEGDIAHEIAWEGNDYMILLGDESDLDDLDAHLLDVAYVHRINLQEDSSKLFGFTNRNGSWLLESLQQLSFEEHPQGDFLRFYQQFATDEVFRLAHIAQPLMITLPDEEMDEDLDEEDPTQEDGYAAHTAGLPVPRTNEDAAHDEDLSDEETAPDERSSDLASRSSDRRSITGTIDADQFPAFAPELPTHQFTIIEHTSLLPTNNRVVMVVCNLASGISDLLTFERHNQEWRLVKLER